MSRFDSRTVAGWTPKTGRPERFEVTEELTHFARILEPRDAIQPILNRAMQGAVHAWLVELNAASDFETLETRSRRTCLLAGPPGCGKTTLAHHVAQRLGLPLVVASMEDVIGMYLGETGKNLRMFMREAERQAGLFVLFLDELDAIGGRRGGRMDSSGDADRNAVVVHIIQMMDRLAENRGYLFAATNRPDIIDPAIWRRFQIQMRISEPDADARFAIMKRYLAPLQWSDAGFDALVSLTAEATPALLREVMEGIKRDYVLSRRLGFAFTPYEVFTRVLATIAPHDEARRPALWARVEDGRDDWLDRLDWPPVCPPEVLAKLTKTDAEIAAASKTRPGKRRNGNGDDAQL